MGIACFLAFFVLSHLLLHPSAEDDKSPQPNCLLSFQCKSHFDSMPLTRNPGSSQSLSFPFTNNSYPTCGLEINCDEELAATVKLGMGRSYNVTSIFTDYNHPFLEVHDQVFQHHLSARDCDATFKNLTLYTNPTLSFITLAKVDTRTFFKCNDSLAQDLRRTEAFFTQRGYKSYTNCQDKGDSVYYMYPEEDKQPTPPDVPPQCSPITLPVKLPREPPQNVDEYNPFTVLSAHITLALSISDDCVKCRSNGGQCLNVDQGHYNCAKINGTGNKPNYKMILGTAIPGAAILTFLIMLVIHRRNKWGYVPSYFPSRNTSSDPSSRADLEAGSIYFGVHVFTYAQLEEATDNFDPSKELGDGGFGTVYYGKLRDGREVAVKRLYEHNYKRMEQFMNEIEILTRMRHPNLVSLYGCTSRQSRELLLVYEYIPNGTVADHLHGEQAKPGSLPWPVRMNIAIETASALAYLHASDIIHRDVKTNNILLDSNFCVKVADFGLSRLFPTDVTHVSTAPQGTPGYVDPEYHQCYQLTDKSDVYSFGVVLIELISSMPAVDISRHRHEINLANLALNRIQNCAFNELVDSSLGFSSDATVERMTTSVAELAFQCLQYERELRPTMDDVLKALMEIQGQENKDDKLIDNVGVLGSEQPPPSPESDDAVLLKSSDHLLHSPDSVTNKWDSMSTTPSTSGLHST